MNHPLVTVIVPVYNGERFVAQAIEAILAQDYPALELIVVDDGSTDATREIVSGYPRALCISQSNAGPSAARNAGIEASTGDLLTFCDCDDMYRPDKVSSQVRHLEQNTDAACVLVHHQAFVEPGTEPPAWMMKDDQGVQSPMIRRRVLETVGGYDPEYRMSETIEWLARMKGAGLRVDVIDNVLVDRRIHGSNLSYERQGLQQSLLRSLRARIDENRKAGDPR
jgi:glycosyltransferase involved in cell wall biosynthesis